MKQKILVQNTSISVYQQDRSDFISLTDIARAKNADEPKDVVKNWLRSRNTIEFLGLWEQINNPDFKGVEFDPFKIRVIYLLPQPQKLDGVSASKPVFYHIFWLIGIFGPCDIRKRYKVASVLLVNGYACVLDKDFLLHALLLFSALPSHPRAATTKSFRILFLTNVFIE